MKTLIIDSYCLGIFTIFVQIVLLFPCRVALIHYSNAVILNPSFSLALSRFLLTIIRPWLSVRYAHACINRMDSPTDKRGLFLNNLDIIFISSPNLLPEIKSNALERE